jgi:hypothetical protein
VGNADASSAHKHSFRLQAESLHPQERGKAMGLMQGIDKLFGQDDEKVRAGERGLIVYSEFSNTSDQHKVLYEFVEKSGIALALAIRLQYNKFVILSGHNAYSQDFIGALKNMAASEDELDVFMHMHGSPNQMYFNDTKSSNELRSDIQKLGIGKKLRMFYTTACYGSTHAEDMVAAGFSCAAGAVGVNANSAVEYPEFLTLWSTGTSFKDCIAKSRNRGLSEPFENKAVQMGFRDVNSDKRVYGNGNVTITTNAS